MSTFISIRRVCSIIDYFYENENYAENIWHVFICSLRYTTSKTDLTRFVYFRKKRWIRSLTHWKELVICRGVFSLYMVSLTFITMCLRIILYICIHTRSIGSRLEHLKCIHLFTGASVYGFRLASVNTDVFKRIVYVTN